MKKIILSETRVDFKYKNIFGRNSDLQVIDGGFIELLKILVKKKSYYHIRYIKYRGYLLTPLLILVVYFLSKLSRSKIIWTCHNIYEHKIPSKKFNNFLRVLLSLVSSDIIVFHKDLIRYLPSFAQKKIKVACFGDYKIFIENQNEENPDFSAKYNQWLDLRKIDYPELVSISAAKKNNLATFLDQLNSSSINCLIIAPNVNFEQVILNKNIFFYNDGFVKKEIGTILRNNNKLIGLIGHNNISVPTSIYMYASFGIPIIGIDNKPVNSIIKEYSIGEIFQKNSSLEYLIKIIKDNYSFYSQNCSKFLKDNNWEKSAEIHKGIFQ